MFFAAQYIPLLIPLIFILLVILFGAILFFLATMYKREKTFQEKQAKIIEDYNQIFDQAHAKAREIINQASAEAQNILAQTQENKSNLDQSVRDAFIKLTQDQVQLLHTNSEKYAKNYQDSLQEVKDHYTKSLETLLQQVRQKTEEQFIGSEESMQKKIKESFDQAQVQINEYKRHQLQQVDQSIVALIARISEDVLGKAISLRDHQQLILESLEQAKKEGMFET